MNFIKLSIFSLIILASAPALAGVELSFSPPKIDYAKVCKRNSNFKHTLKTPDPSLSAKDAYSRSLLLINGTSTIPSDPHRAVAILERLVNTPDVQVQIKAKRQLARQLLMGVGALRDEDRAVLLLKEVVNRAPLTAGMLLGLNYRKSEKYAQAVEYLKRSAVAGEPVGYLTLASIYYSRSVTPPTADAADNMLALAQNFLLEKLARGECKALPAIAKTFLYPLFHSYDIDLAVEWLKVGVQAENRSSIVMLAQHYKDNERNAEHTKTATELFKKAAAMGSNAAMFELGEQALQDGDIKNAELWLERASLYNHSRATRLLIKHYLGNDSTEPQYAKATKWLQHSIKKVDTSDKLFYWLAELYEEGKGVSRDYTKAFDLYNNAARRGSVEAQVKMGEFFKYGKGVAYDPMRSYRFYRIAASNKNRDAMVALIDNYQCGVGRPISAKNSEKWREYALYHGAGKLVKDRVYDLLNTSKPEAHKEVVKLVEQRIKNDEDQTAMALLSMLYEHGTGVSKDMEKQKVWFNKATKFGTRAQQAKAHAILGKYALLKDTSYFSPLKAEGYFLQAQALSLPEASYRLAELYSANYKELQNAASQAKEQMLKAAQEGYVPAMRKLGREIVKTSEGDVTNGLAWLEKAADKSDLSSMLELASYYAKQGVQGNATAGKWLDAAYKHHPCSASEKNKIRKTSSLVAMNGSNPEERLKRLKELANKGDSASMLQLATDYLTRSQQGDLAKNAELAREWFVKAADTGSAEALFELGNMHATGLGVTQSAAEARKWWEKAAKLGHPIAKEML